MIEQVIVKLNRACNLRCSYCYYINDKTSHYGQRLPWPVLGSFLDQYTMYCRKKNTQGIVGFHGGEPLLMGKAYMGKALSHEGFTSKTLIASLQSNGTLVDAEWANLFAKNSVSVGISIDGPAPIHDAARRDARGRGTSHLTERGIGMLLRTGVCLGTITVANPNASGRETFTYLADMGIKWMDFLLPITNHVTGRPSLQAERSLSAYLGEAYVAWIQRNDPSIRIRLFETLLHRAAGRDSGYAAVGGRGLDRMAVLETNGEYCLLEELEDIDRLDSGTRYRTGQFAQLSTLDRLEQFVSHFWSEHMLRALPTPCTRCPVSHVCQGGSFATRFGAGSSFDNESAYCNVLKDLSNLLIHSMNLYNAVRTGGVTPNADSTTHRS